MNQENEQIEYGELSYRARIRDLYVSFFRRTGVLERMAMSDYHFLAYSKGRIEIVEEVALGARTLPNNFIMNEEEKHYAGWLQAIVNGESGGILLRDFFFHGMPDEAPLLIRGEVA